MQHILTANAVYRSTSDCDEIFATSTAPCGLWGYVWFSWFIVLLHCFIM